MVYKQEGSTDAYLYQTNLPKLQKFTICFWIKRTVGGNREKKCLLSIYAGQYKVQVNTLC